MNSLIAIKIIIVIIVIIIFCFITAMSLILSKLEDIRSTNNFWLEDINKELGYFRRESRERNEN